MFCYHGLSPPISKRSELKEVCVMKHLLTITRRKDGRTYTETKEYLYGEYEVPEFKFIIDIMKSDPSIKFIKFAHITEPLANTFEESQCFSAYITYTYYGRPYVVIKESKYKYYQM